jgi:hypothetical protein
MPRNRIDRILVVAAIALLAGCAAPVQKQTNELRRSGTPPRIVLMPLDVELSELSAGGLAEPKAAWTDAAYRNIEAALSLEGKERNLVFVPYVCDKGTTEDRETAQELSRLHRAVGGSVLLHQYVPNFQLPSKQGKFDWSLGPSVATLARTQDADYAAFFYVRDSYASAGRAAVMVVSALFGVGLPGGRQVGFASLVDLKTGDIVWFNRLNRPTGDLRTPEAARETVKALLTDAPR